MAGSEMGDLYGAWKEEKREHRLTRLQEAEADDAGFTKLNGGLHWQTQLAGSLLDYWPTTGRWRWKDKIHKGGHQAMRAFMAARQRPAKA